MAFPSPTSSSTVRLYRQAILLARKYDCPATTLSLQATIRSSLLDSSVFPFSAFRLLATLEDDQGCANAIRRAGSWHWLGDSDLGASTPLDSFVQKWSAFYVASWSMKDFRDIPQHFTLALMRATIAAKRPLWKDTDWKTVAKTFTVLLLPGESFPLTEAPRRLTESRTRRLTTESRVIAHTGRREGG
jgi:hypothetical protein